MNDLVFESVVLIELSFPLLRDIRDLDNRHDDMIKQTPATFRINRI